MEKRILGRTGLDVSVVGMGGLFVSRLGGTGREEARRTVQRAVALGVNYVDTAPTYADSEEMLGYALAGAPTPTAWRGRAHLELLARAVDLDGDNAPSCKIGPQPAGVGVRQKIHC